MPFLALNKPAPPRSAMPPRSNATMRLAMPPRSVTPTRPDTTIRPHARPLITSTCLGLMLLLNGCASPEQSQMAAQVITALPHEVKDCIFIDNIDARPRMSLASARFDFKLKAAQLGATHVIEAIAYPERPNKLSWDFGLALSGRAYKCPAGVGPTQDNPEGILAAPEIPQPSMDDYWGYGP